jgi:SAM-dependent methyltransferase
MQGDEIMKQNTDVYNTIAREFAKTRVFVWDDLKPLVRFTQPKNRVLDLGCGTGRLYQVFANFQGAEAVYYTGVDVSQEQIAVAKETYIGVDFRVAEMCKLPFDDGSFDVVYCIAAFHHLPSAELQLVALKEIARVLVPGGRLIMTNWNLKGEWGQQKVESGAYQKRENENYIVPWKNADGVVMGERVYHAFTLEELASLCEQAGFVLEENYYTHLGEVSDVVKGQNIVTVTVIPAKAGIHSST